MEEKNFLTRASPSRRVSLLSAEGEVLLSPIIVASSFLDRAKGLMGRKEEEAFSLLLVACSSIHTCFMRFPIDVLFLDRQREVTDVYFGVRPWRMFLRSPKAFLCIETIAGKMPRQVQRGQCLRIKEEA